MLSLWCCTLIKPTTWYNKSIYMLRVFIQCWQFTHCFIFKSVHALKEHGQSKTPFNMAYSFPVKELLKLPLPSRQQWGKIQFCLLLFKYMTLQVKAAQSSTFFILYFIQALKLIIMSVPTMKLVEHSTKIVHTDSFDRNRFL